MEVTSKVKMISEFRLRKIFENNGLDCYDTDSVKLTKHNILSQDYGKYKRFIECDEHLYKYMNPWECLFDEILDSSVDFECRNFTQKRNTQTRVITETLSEWVRV